MDNVNTVGDALRDSFSTLINKDGKIFKALVANPDGNGTLESIFNAIETVRKKWCNNPDIYNQAGEMLEKTMSFFSFLTRIFNESDESFKKRHELLFYRGGDTIWGDMWNIRKIFRLYFNTNNVWIINNTNSAEENILEDGDFEAGTAWELEMCSYDHEARFSERTGIKFNGLGTCRQTVEANQDSTYFIHFFLDGKITLRIKDNNDRYWNPRAGEFGAWGSSVVDSEFSSSGWDARSMYYLTDDLTSEITITFSGIQNEVAMIDYVRLFLKDGYSSFTLLVLFGGMYTEETMSLAPGKDDPIVRRDYEGFGHYSAGKDDADTQEAVSYIENDALNEDQDPVMAKGVRNVGPIEKTNDMYIDEDTPIAPWKDDVPGFTVDYSKMSYIEQSHIFGTEGGGQARAASIYKELLEMVRAGGITSYIDLLTRELDE
jgi:hypothetical protein